MSLPQTGDEYIIEEKHDRHWRATSFVVEQLVVCNGETFVEVVFDSGNKSTLSLTYVNEHYFKLHR